MRMTYKMMQASENDEGDALQISKKVPTEAAIRTKFITPTLVGENGGKRDAMTQIAEEIYFIKDLVIVRGKPVKRGEAKKVDYLHIAINLTVEAIDRGENRSKLKAQLMEALSR